jgi:hypothetical protein
MHLTVGRVAFLRLDNFTGNKLSPQCRFFQFLQIPDSLTHFEVFSPTKKALQSTQGVSGGM